MDIICDALASSGIILENETAHVREMLLRDTEWSSNAVWLAYATRLDQSRVMFYLPDMYNALVKLTGEDFGYYKAKTCSGDITLFIIGVWT